MKKELKILEIMRDCHVTKDKAVKLFNEEVCKRYSTNDLKLAEDMFNASRRLNE